MLLNKKIIKPVPEQVIEITFSNLQAHTTRFVVFTMQRPSDPHQVWMVTGRSDANAVLLNWSNFKAIGVKFVGILTTPIYYQLRICLKSASFESTSRKCFVPAVNLVIFMAQRPNMAVLSESEVCENFMRFS